MIHIPPNPAVTPATEALDFGGYEEPFVNAVVDDITPSNIADVVSRIIKALPTSSVVDAAENEVMVIPKDPEAPVLSELAVPDFNAQVAKKLQGRLGGGLDALATYGTPFINGMPKAYTSKAILTQLIKGQKYVP